MKRLAMVLVMACALGTVTSELVAQQTQEAPKKKPARHKKKKPLLYGAHAQMAKVCELSEQQQKKIAELNAVRKKALAAFNAEDGDKLKALREELKKARQTKDKEAAREASSALASLHAKRNGIIEKSQAEILAVLTPEQRAKWDEYTIMRSIKAGFRAAQLTEDQLAKIKAEYVKAAAGTDVSTKKGRAKILRDLAAKINKEILTEDQRTAVAVAQITRRYRKFKLTDAQVAQIKAAYVKHMTGADTSERGGRQQALKKLTEEIRAEIFTDRQRELLAKPKPKRKPKTEGGKQD